VENGVDLERFTADLIEVMRKILLVKVNTQLGGFAGALGKDLEKKVFQAASDVDLVFLVKAIDVLIVKKQDLKYAAIAQLPLELAVIEIIGDNTQNSNDHTPPATPAVKVDKKVPAVEPDNTALKIVIKTIKADEPKISVAKKASISLDNIKKKWGEVIALIKDQNHSLTVALKVSKPHNVVGNTLQVALKHKFYQQRLNEDKNRKMLEELLEKIYQEKLLFEAVVDESMVVEAEKSDKDKPAGENESIDNLLKAFGGQAVE